MPSKRFPDMVMILLSVITSEAKTLMTFGKRMLEAQNFRFRLFSLLLLNMFYRHPINTLVWHGYGLINGDDIWG